MQRGIPSGTPAVDLLVQPIKGIYWYFVWKQIIKIDNEKKRWVVFGVLTFLLGFFVEQPLCVAGNAFILLPHLAYHTGLVFGGLLDFPIRDLRRYHKGIPRFVRMAH